jgi:hypothetical protein
MKTKIIKEHVFSSAPIPRCIYCGADEDDAFVGGEECTEREVKDKKKKGKPNENKRTIPER